PGRELPRPHPGEDVAELLGGPTPAGREQVDPGARGQRGASAQEQRGGLGVEAARTSRFGMLLAVDSGCGNSEERCPDVVLHSACPLHGDPLVCVPGSTGACATQLTLRTLYHAGKPRSWLRDVGPRSCGRAPAARRRASGGPARRERPAWSAAACPP